MRINHRAREITRKPLALAAGLALVGGAAVATGSIPSSGSGEVHLCFQKRAANQERGGAELRVIDNETNDRCMKGDRRLAINQQGPTGPQGIQGETGEQGSQGETGPAGSQGPQGIQGERGEDGGPGPQGPAGISDAFSASNPGPVDINNNTDQRVVARAVPPGSFVVQTTLALENNDDDVNEFGRCGLWANGTLLQSTATLDFEGVADRARRYPVALSGVVSLVARGTLEVTCRAGLASNGRQHDLRAHSANLSAIKVDQVNPVGP